MITKYRTRCDEFIKKHTIPVQELESKSYRELYILFEEIEEIKKSFSHMNEEVMYAILEPIIRQGGYDLTHLRVKVDLYDMPRIVIRIYNITYPFVFDIQPSKDDTFYTHDVHIEQSTSSLSVLYGRNITFPAYTTLLYKLTNEPEVTRNLQDVFDIVYENLCKLSEMFKCRKDALDKASRNLMEYIHRVKTADMQVRLIEQIIEEKPRFIRVCFPKTEFLIKDSLCVLENKKCFICPDESEKFYGNNEQDDEIYKGFDFKWVKPYYVRIIMDRSNENTKPIYPWAIHTDDINI